MNIKIMREKRARRFKQPAGITKSRQNERRDSNRSAVPTRAPKVQASQPAAKAPQAEQATKPPQVPAEQAPTTRHHCDSV